MRITDQAVVRTVRVTVAVAAGVAVVASALTALLGEVEYWLTEYLAAFTLIALCCGAFAWVVIPHQPRNAAVWVMAVASLCGVYVAGMATVLLVYDGDPLEALAAAPADLSAPALWALAFAVLGWGVGFNALMTFGLLLFPDGRLPSRRWRPVAWLSAGSILALMLSYGYNLRPGNTAHPDHGEVLAAAVGLHLLATLLSLAALVIRYRHSRGQTRQQFKWVAWGGAVFVPIFVVTVMAGGSRYESVTAAPFTVATAVLLVSYGIAVGKYRLYDVDLVIARTLVYGALAAFITGAYVAVVVGVGRLLGRGDGPDTALALAVTAGVAVAFQPLRRRLQQLADRLVYGRKVTPHDVLSSFSRRLAAPDDALFAQVARSLVEGTGADHAAVRLRVDGRFVEAARWPSADGAVGRELVTCPIEHDGAELGELRLGTPTGQRLSERDLRLAREVSAGLALALRNRLLTGTLRARVAELRESRRRLVAARDETRRRLERDLHDGAQQQLVALKVKLGLAQAVAEREGGSGAATLLRRLAQRADQAVEAVRDFARGVYPPMLEAEGLGSAITAQARRQALPVTVEVGRIGRHPRQIEATVYFCIVELLQSFADCGRCELRVRVHEEDRIVHFEVTEAGGRGAAPDVEDRAALVDVTDRLDAADGTVSVHTEPDGATSVRCSIPIEARQ